MPEEKPKMDLKKFWEKYRKVIVVILIIIVIIIIAYIIFHFWSISYNQKMGMENVAKYSEQIAARNAYNKKINSYDATDPNAGLKNISDNDLNNGVGNLQIDEHYGLGTRAENNKKLATFGSGGLAIR